MIKEKVVCPFCGAKDLGEAEMRRRARAWVKRRIEAEIKAWEKEPSW
ncbi:MAG: hypothetical protein Q8R15_00730 [Candidatus Micrarchaeota archaeon]|nr:hypothetical protein [Candidatus Micrarchaeota archaeon]